MRVVVAQVQFGPPERPLTRPCGGASCARRASRLADRPSRFLLKTGALRRFVRGVPHRSTLTGGGGIAWAIGFLFFAAVLPAVADSFEASEAYTRARSNYLAQATNANYAWKFAQACFEWADFASNDTQRAALAQEGIAAAQLATEIAPTNAAGHFYLAMNKGQLARTRTLGALPLVKEMEKSFLRAIELDPEFRHAAPPRSLGILYREAPGWPASIGNRSRARNYLEKAVELDPVYPENLLTLLEAYSRWDETEALQAGIARYQRLHQHAKETFAGPAWAESWIDWDSRWQELLKNRR
jgi:tetratricopeptide (TPR) repeat protein